MYLRTAYFRCVKSKLRHYRRFSWVLEVTPGKSAYRNVWSAAEMQAKNEEWQMVCANVFGLEWSQRLRAMMDVRSLSSL